METWKDIPGYSGIYQASDLGNIRSAPIKLISDDGNETLFPSMAAASRSIGRNPSYVSNSLARGNKIISKSGMVYTVLG